MLIEKVEHLKEWLTISLAPICEADSGALARYVVALVKKDKSLTELKDSCVDQLDVFLQAKTKDFVEDLFEVLTNKSYIKEEEAKQVPLPDTTAALIELVPLEPEIEVEVPQEALTPVVDELKQEEEEENKEPVPPVEEPKRRLSRSRSPRYRPRDDDRRRRYDDRRPYERDRGFPRRRSISPRDLRHRVTGRGRSRSPVRRRSPFRPVQRSRSPRMRGRGRGRSRSRSLSHSLSPRRSWSRSRSRERFVRSRSKSLPLRSKSRSPRREVRPPRVFRSRSPRLRSRSRSPRYWSPRKRSRSPGDKSPRSRSRSPRSRGNSLSPRRSRSLSPPRKVRRHSDNSRGPTPTEENGLADSTNKPNESLSSISVVTHSGGRYVDAPPPSSRLRCRDFDEKGFCVRGDLCVFDHGVDPVVVEKYSVPPQYPPVPPGPPPPMGMNVPPPGFLPRMPGMMVRGPRPDFPPEPEYNPEAPGIAVPPPPIYWPGPGIPPPHFLRGPPPPLMEKAPVTRELVTVIEPKAELKEEEDDDQPTSSSSTRTVIAPKDDSPTSSTEPPPPGVQDRPAVEIVKVEPAIRYQPPVVKGYQSQHYMRPHQRFHPYGGPRKPFDFNRVGGYRKPDQTNCTLEVRKVPKEFNNISKLNEHFGKFGTLKNIQVSFEGDPEGALVTFSSNAEAAACYKCSEPVFNNRFIKVFWHNKEKQEPTNTQEQAPTSTTTLSGPDDGIRQPAQTRLGPLPPASKMSLNNMVKKPPAVNAAAVTIPAVTAPAVIVPAPAAPAVTTPTEKTIAYTSTMGHISKTVYNPVAIKAKAKAELTSPTAVKAADFVSRMEAVKQSETIKKEAALKKLEIQKFKQQLLEKQIEQQKALIGRLETKKEMGAEEKSVIMKTLKTLTDSIDKLKTELGRRIVVKKETEGVTVKSPEQAKKEILDVELELMTKTTKGEDTLELKKKLLDLQKIANSMGLLGRGRGRGAVGRGRGSTTWVASGIVPPVGRGRGRGALLGRASVAARTLDRRPKQVEVKGFTVEEKDEIAMHLGKLDELENIDFKMEVPCAILTFKTRRDAELGITHGSKFKSKVLKMSWHIPKPDISSSISHVSTDSDLDTEAGAGAGASSTSVGPSRGNWLAAHRADLTLGRSR